MNSVRALRHEDAEALRALRLEALRLSPEAFGSVYAAEAEDTVADFAGRIARGGLFGGFAAGHLVGMAAFSSYGAAQLAHKGTLGGMYVREAARGSGLAGAIVEAILDHARGRVEQVLLSVSTANTRAIRFYERLGFVSYATEPRALKVGTSYVDEYLMVRFFA